MGALHAPSHFLLVTQVNIELNHPRVEHMLKIVFPQVLTTHDPEGFGEGMALPEVPDCRYGMDLVPEFIDCGHKLWLLYIETIQKPFPEFLGFEHEGEDSSPIVLNQILCLCFPSFLFLMSGFGLLPFIYNLFLFRIKTVFWLLALARHFGSSWAFSWSFNIIILFFLYGKLFFYWNLALLYWR